MQNANKALDKIGKKELGVDLEKIPSSKDYEVKIQQLIKNALSGKNAVTIEDIYNTKKMIEKTKEERNEKNRRDEDEK